MSEEKSKEFKEESVPQHCPGVESDNAGKSNACAGCPNQNFCSTNTVKGPDPDIEKIKERMKSVKHKILVLSGKGGVGKSTFSAQLSYALASTTFKKNEEENNEDDEEDDEEDHLNQIGILDIDICGPSIPKITGVQGQQIHHSSFGWTPIYAEENIGVMSIGFLLPSEDDAVIWRGPKKNGLIKQFLTEVYWGSEGLDYLIVDTPPGTSDEHLSIVQYLQNCDLTGAIIISTPQEVSLLDVRKEISFCKKVDIPILGIVENMSGFVCPNCKNKTEIFFPSTGGCQALAEELDLPFLGKIPLDPTLARAADEGTNYFEECKNSPAFQPILDIVTSLHERINNNNN
eukprot:TRINITY_DN197_c0_g4_i1.p1 TRINITY_DN197_c0_g4~~TRINITY_DN197_c0_g4_i1.p1  ORF type:complete len:345 (-),score=152.70 TRINITY_DN197_c0_g4_i1:160-1194(-)